MLQAKKRPEGKILKVSRIEDTLVLHSEAGILGLQPQNEFIIRVMYTKGKEFYDGLGIGIVRNEPFYDWRYEETENAVRLVTSDVELEISKTTSSIKYYDRKGKLLLSERSKESRILEEFDSFRMVLDEKSVVEKIETPDGIKGIVKESAKIFDKKLYHTRLFLNWQGEEALFGLGQAEEGILNLRGTTQYLNQANMKIAIPLLLSTNGYGILLSTGSPAIFSDTQYGSYLYTEADHQMDYYFIAGENFDRIIKGYRILTGKAAMLPKWAFGYMQSQERYETQQEIIDIVREHREKGIGLDTIILDWCSWKDGMWGQKTFDKERFPDATGMIEEIHEMNARFMISIWPIMNENCENYNEFESRNLLLPASNIYDAFNKEARDLYWKQTNEGLSIHGVDAWWCDSSEPLTPEWTRMEKPEPSAMFCEFIQESSKFIPVEKCNSYGLVHAQGIYEGQRNTSHHKRVLNLTRSGYTGQQRYGTVLWSGDTCASWQTLQKQIVAGLNFCASGIPYWTLDIGAFFVKKGLQWFWDGEYENGCDDLGYRELYTRWYQYGAFLPIFRSHGTDTRRELWNYGQPGDMFYDALLRANQLRYQLMPYIYSISGSVWRNDETMMRMLAFDFKYDNRAINITDQFLFGTSLMVCPVTNPMYFESGSVAIKDSPKTRSVYLPDGVRWYDFWTNQVHEGGRTITVNADIDMIPLFVREGGIIPMSQTMCYVDEVIDAPLEVRVYPGIDSCFDLYEDDGDGYQYENGAYSITKMVWNDKERKLTIHGPEGSFSKMISNRNYQVHIMA